LASGHRVFVNKPVIVYDAYNTLALSTAGHKVVKVSI